MTALRRLLPDGLAGRFALLLGLALIAANLVALALFSVERARLDRAALIGREMERIVSMVPVIEAAEPDRRGAIAHQASTRLSRISVERRPVVTEDPADPRAAALSRSLTEALPGRIVRADVMLRGDRNGPRKGAAVAISIELQASGNESPQWLNAVSRDGPPGPPGVDGKVFVIVLGLSLVFVLGVGLLFVRLLTRPLRDLARAARAAGHGDRTIRVAERGAREMREAAGAFNDMQARIARFEAERMRTLAAVGHDLRTPITSLRIRAELLDADEAAPMIRTLEEMTVMAEGLVAYAKGAGDAEQTQTVDLGALLARLCEERGATFAPAARVHVCARPVTLGRALGNLIDNAIRYGGAARVRLVRQDDEAIIAVEDNGPGIAPEHLGMVFEPFVRGEESRSTETGGVGLGLSIARSIVTSHGGIVTLENSATGGLTATVRLPVKSTT